MKGSMSARVVAPPRPGSSPTQKPTTIPSSMKAKAFHCSTSTRPSSSASSTANCRIPYDVRNQASGRSFAELDVLRELVDDVLGLREHVFHHLERFVARDEIEVELRFLRFGLERGIVDRLGERRLHDLHQLLRRARRHDIRAA